MIHYYSLDIDVVIEKNEYEIISLYINIPYSDWDFRRVVKIDMRIP